MLNKPCSQSLVACLVLLGLSSLGHADGVVQNASKDVAKGAVKGAQQELRSGELVNGAKELSKSMIDGVATAAPLITSQVANQANVNRKAIGNTAKQVASDAVSGAIGATVRQVDGSIGKNADGPLADTMAATAERVTAAAIHGLVSEIHLDPASAEKLSAAMVRGAVSEMHVNMPVWPFALAFVLGSVSAFLCGLGLTLLYVLFQRRRAPAAIAEGAAPRSSAHGTPAFSARETAVRAELSH